MTNINDRIGSQNVIRVLTNSPTPNSKLINLTDVNSTLKTEESAVLIWDLSTQTFIMTDVIDGGEY